jgi:hypothetical protein
MSKDINLSNSDMDLSKYFATGDDAGVFGYKAENTIPKISGNGSSGTDTGLHLGTGIHAPFLDIATPAVFTPAVVVVTSVPAMYSTPRYQFMGRLIKSLIESHAKTISGIDVEYTLNTDTNAQVGHDSQSMSVPLKTIRNAQTPSMSMQELSGNLVYETFNKWMWDISHPDTYVSMAGDVFPGAWTMSAYAMSMLVIQFDPTMRPDRIIDAAFFSNMFPTSIGSLGLERSIGNVKSMERSVNFAQAIVQHNKYVKEMAIAVAENLQLHVINYDHAPTTFSDVTSDIAEHGLMGESIHRGDTKFEGRKPKQLKDRAKGFLSDVLKDTVDRILK